VIAAALAVTTVVSGATLAIESARMSRPALGVLAGASPLFVLVIPLASVTVFTMLVGLGLCYRRRAAAHKRLMLLATLALLPPALARVQILNAIGPQAFFGVTVVFLVAVMAYDYWTRRCVHVVSLWGGLFLALSFPGRIALGHTNAWLTLARLARSLSRNHGMSTAALLRWKSIFGSEPVQFHRSGGVLLPGMV
jgi:hypothetical protein